MNKQKLVTELRGIPLVVTYVYEAGSPGSRLDPPDPEGFEIYDIALVAQPDIDIMVLLDESIICEIEEQLWGVIRRDEEDDDA